MLTAQRSKEAVNECERFDSLTQKWSICAPSIPPSKELCSSWLSFVYRNAIWFTGTYVRD
jgi:hypothetical protein